MPVPGHRDVVRPSEPEVSPLWAQCVGRRSASAALPDGGEPKDLLYQLPHLMPIGLGGVESHLRQDIMH